MSSHHASSTLLATPDAMRAKMKRLAKLKGRQTDTDSLEAVRALMGERPVTGYPRDMLIEYLHKLQDAYRGLHEGHMVALAREMNIPMAEVYEVPVVGSQVLVASVQYLVEATPEVASAGVRVILWLEPTQTLSEA